MERKINSRFFQGPSLKTTNDGGTDLRGARIINFFGKEALAELNARYAGDTPLLEVIDRELKRLGLGIN